MWKEISLKINILKEYDKCFAAYGAGTHKYTFGSKLTESDLIEFEQQNNIRLPIQLREFYLFFGDGGPSPDYGMHTLEQLDIYKQNNKEDDEYFYEFNENIASFIAIMDRYYAYETCIVSSGKALGHLYGLENSCFQYDEGKDLVQIYHTWLGSEILNFKILFEEIKRNQNITEIMYNLFLNHGFQPAKTISYLSSLIEWKDVNKKVTLYILPRFTQTNSRKVYLPESATSEFNFRIGLYLQKLGY